MRLWIASDRHKATLASFNEFEGQLKIGSSCNTNTVGCTKDAGLQLPQKTTQSIAFLRLTPLTGLGESTFDLSCKGDESSLRAACTYDRIQTQ